MALSVPVSANSNKPRPLPDVDPQWLLMAAAHMQQIGKFDPFTGSAYNAESKFSDSEMSKNLEDRRVKPNTTPDSQDFVDHLMSSTTRQVQGIDTTPAIRGRDTRTPGR